MPVPCLHTPRLQLRELTSEDAPSLLALYADRDHMRWYATQAAYWGEQYHDMLQFSLLRADAKMA